MPLISPQTIEQVAAASDIVEVIGSYFPLKRAGTEFRALCPFHQEKTPSFYVSPSKQSYYCHGCGAGGAVFQFLMQYENVDFPEAVRRLAIRAGIPVIEDEFSAEEEARQGLRKRLLRLHFEAAAWFHRNLVRTRAAEHARNYLSGRSLNLESAKQWQLGYAPDSWDTLVRWANAAGFTREELIESGLVKLQDDQNPASKIYDRFRNRLMFPICNDIGEVIAFSGRILNAEAVGAKYVNSPETQLFSKGNVLFGLDKSKRSIANARSAIVLEGQLDLITAYEAGIQNVVAPQGTAVTEKHAALLRRFSDEVILFFDSDSAGQKAAERALEVMFGASLQVRVGEMPPGEDPDSLIRKAGAENFKKLIAEAKEFFDYQIQRNLGDVDSKSLAERLSFARRMAQFVNCIPPDTADRATTLRDATIHRLASRLKVTQESFKSLASAEWKNRSTDSRLVSETARRPAMPKHAIARLCEIALTDSETLQWIRSQPWQVVLEQIPGSDLLIRILSSNLYPEDQISLSNWLAGLDSEEAGIISTILSQKYLYSGAPRLAKQFIDAASCRTFWSEFALRELRTRKTGLESALRLSADSPDAVERLTAELKEVLDLETRITDISRLSSRAP